MERIAKWWEDLFQTDAFQQEWWRRKRALCEKRGIEISRIRGKGHIFQELRYDNQTIFQYQLHLSYLMKQNDFFYREEQVIPLQFRIDPDSDQAVEHSQLTLSPQPDEEKPTERPGWDERDPELYRFTYDRLAAVKYAERWWNDYNPAYEQFHVDCTNYVSQCLHAGGAPMRGAPDRGNGWWYQHNNWSYSWSVSNALRWYLSGSTKGLQGREVEDAKDLVPGDVICYDFEGDGKWDHTTIVVAKDVYGMPLVNAHTENSRNRYWSYEDSTAWTPNIAYKFFHIGE